MIRVDGRGEPVFADSLVRTARLLGLCVESGLEDHTKLLNSGDVAFVLPGTLVGIERKTIPDFAESFVSGRLREQLARMRTQYHYPYLLLEGEIHWVLEAKSGKLHLGLKRRGSTLAIGLNHATVMNFQNGLRLSDPPVGLIRTQDIADSVITVLDFYRMLANRKPGEEGLSRVKIKEGRSRQVHPGVAALAQVPDVGYETAFRILKHTRSIENLLRLDEREMLAIPGIGKKIRDQILKTFKGEA